MREIPDIFSGNAFTAVTLTAHINNAPYVPNLLGSIGLFSNSGVRTTDIAISELNGALTIIPTSPRGSPPTQKDNEKGKVRKATAVHFERERKVMADEVQGVLQHQGAGLVGVVDPALAALNTPEALINERLNGPFGLRQEIELTHEHHRLGAVKGIVLDADGATELFDWYDFFGIEALAAKNVNFGTLTAEGGAFELACTQIVREMVDELDGLPLTSMQPVVLCGDNYFDAVVTNKEVKAARKTRDTGKEGDVFQQNKAYTSIRFAGITFVNYRGFGNVSINTDKGRLFPLGVPGLFQMLFAPADLLGYANTLGLPVYADMAPERQTSKMATVQAQSNPLTVCVRPRALRELGIAT